MKSLFSIPLIFLIGPVLACEVSATHTYFYPQDDNISFYTEPDPGSTKVVNKGASEFLGQTQYRTLGQSMVLESKCETPNWLKGKIIEADGRAVDWESGWVERKYVSPVKNSDQAAGLLWNPASDKEMTDEERAVVKSGALEVLKMRSDCEKIVLGSRSGKEAGLYFVMCVPSTKTPFNVWFAVSAGKPGTLRILSDKPPGF